MVVAMLALATAVAHAGPDARELHERARTAAQRGNCSTRDLLVAQIEDLDPAYYAREVAGDPRVTTCHPGAGSTYTPYTPPPPPPLAPPASVAPTPPPGPPGPSPYDENAAFVA